MEVQLIRGTLPGGHYTGKYIYYTVPLLPITVRDWARNASKVRNVSFVRSQKALKVGMVN